jgi:hypothetical protein
MERRGCGMKDHPVKARGRSIQTHYLPRKAYLSFFESADPAGSIFMYQREQAPICVSTKKAGRERDLYCFTDDEGNFNSEIEKTLERVEAEAYPILLKLNEAQEDFDLTAEEWLRISIFVATQLVRTPGWLHKTERMAGEFAKAWMMKMAASDGMWEAVNRETPKKFPKMPIERVREFILSGEFDIATGGPYYLGLSLKMAGPAMRAVFMRDPVIVRPREREFVTSDHPVVMRRHEKSLPTWGAGVVNSHFLFPIGSKAMLDLRVQLGRKVDAARKSVRVKVRRIGNSQLNAINALTIRNAERFVFASLSSKTVARLFDLTETPRRFRVDSPSRAPFIVVRSD